MNNKKNRNILKNGKVMNLDKIINFNKILDQFLTINEQFLVVFKTTRK